MKVSELIKLLRKKSCYIVRHGKKHDIWYSPCTKREFPVPRHKAKEFANGTAMNIKKDAEIE